MQGPEFDSATVSEAAEMDPAEVEERLDVLERVHVFVERGAEREFPDLTLTLHYRFVHVLYQNVLYASLQPTRRAALSGRVAKALVAHGEDTPASPPASRCCSKPRATLRRAPGTTSSPPSTRRALCVPRVTVAGRARARRRCAALPEGRPREQQELGLQMIRGQALRMMKGWAAPELEPVFARARQLCHELDDPPEVFPVLWALTLFHAIRGDLRVYRERAEEADDPGGAVRESRVPDGCAPSGRRLAASSSATWWSRAGCSIAAASCTCPPST